MNQPAINDMVTQMTTITTAAGALNNGSEICVAFSRHSSMTSAGISLMTIHMPSGRSRRSSRYPTTGIKSGIRSMGLSAYAATSAPQILAYIGVRQSRDARYRAMLSRLIMRAHDFR